MLPEQMHFWRLFFWHALAFAGASLLKSVST